MSMLAAKRLSFIFALSRAGVACLTLCLSACQPGFSPAPASAPASAAAAASAPASDAAPAASAWQRYADAPTPELAAQAASTSVPGGVLALLQQAHVPLDSVALLVAPAEGGAPLVNHRSAEAMNPASVMKLVTTAAALDTLGPAYAWRTPAWADGTLRDGTLHGNVYLQGRGDPKLVLERLWLLMRDLRATGIHTIDGDLVLDNSLFDVPPQDPGAFDGEPLRPYNASPDALLVNFKAMVLQFVPDAAAQVAHVSVGPPLAGVEVDATLPLSPAGCGHWQKALQADFSDPRAVHFAGSYPAACGTRVWPVAYMAPGQFAARAIAGMWMQAGGSVTGQVRMGRVPQTIARQPPLVEAVSPTLPEVVHDINKYSNNVMAQQVFLTMGLEHSGTGTMPAAAEAVAQWWRSRLGNTPPPVVDNGAGLSRTARISASSLGAMLQAVYQSPVMPEFMASLPVAGIDGTLRKSRLREKGSAHLKTGTLDNASALAGYVLSDSGRRYVFVAMANGENAQAARPAFEALVDWTVQQQKTALAIATPPGNASAASAP